MWIRVDKLLYYVTMEKKKKQNNNIVEEAKNKIYPALFLDLFLDVRNPDKLLWHFAPSSWYIK